jgi:hypothetical protein
MVAIALDGAGASWLDDTAKVTLRQKITAAASAHAPVPPTPNG